MNRREKEKKKEEGRFFSRRQPKKVRDREKEKGKRKERKGREVLA